MPSHITVTPDIVLIRVGQTQQFFSQAYGDQGDSINVAVIWDADGGTIDSTGFYTAGRDTGTFVISATDILSNIIGSAVVKIFPHLAIVSISPESIEIKPNQTQQFTAMGYDSVGSEVEVFAVWEATGGTIDQAGLYSAESDTGYYQVTAEDTLSHISGSAVIHIVLITEIDQTNQRRIPTEFSLGQNYPNPFNPETTIEFSVKEKCIVKLKIFDITGREVATLVKEDFEAGFYHITFDASNLTTGVYLYRIQMKDFINVKKMLLLE